MNKQKNFYNSGKNKKKLKTFFLNRFLSRENLTRDSAVIAVIVILCATIIGFSKYNQLRKDQLTARVDAFIQNHVEEEFQDNSIEKIKSIQSQINTDEWKTYQTKWYGFEIKYPQDWGKPIVGVPVKDSEVL